MHPIIAPIKPGDTGLQVTNLQEAILFLYDQGIFKAFDPPNRPTSEELKALTIKLRDEQTQQIYGDATTQLLRYFQIQQGLGDNLYGVVEDKTAAKLNEILKSLGAFAENAFIVRGTVRDSNGHPLAGTIVRAFDRDLRREELLGETRTDAEGKYEIRYSLEQFKASDASTNTAPDLFVRALGADGQILAESPIRFNASQEETIDLVIPATALSEWVIISQAVTPLLIGQGPEGKPLPPWELNDEDINFIIAETKLDREQVRLWALAAKTAHETNLLGNAALDDAVEFAAFYGWFRDGQPQTFNELIKKPVDDLIASFISSCDRNIISPNLKTFAEKLKAALAARRIDEALKPAGEGKPASLGDLLNTIPEDLLNENSRKTIAVLLNTVSHESDDFLEKAKDAGLNEKQALQVRQTLQLGDLTLKHKPMVKALQAVVKKDADITLNNLAEVRVNQWLELAFEHGAPPQTFMTPEQYAEHLEVMVESKLPTAALLAKLQNQAINFEPKAFAEIHTVLVEYPKFDIATADIDQFVIDTKIKPETASALAKLQHLKRLDTRWDEVEVLVNNGLDSAEEITNYSKNQFKEILGKHILEERLEDIHNQATTLKAVSIGLMGYLLPMMYGVSAEVMGMHKNLDKAKEKINSNPTLRKLFGALEQCHCDPCLSVLSPAAYLADLLKFIDASHEASFQLRRRRPDIYDLELSCENSKIELPQIDLAIEILENIVALPYSVPLPAGTDIHSELSAGKPVGENVRKALEKTAIDKLGNLVAQVDNWTIRSTNLIFGASYWTVNDNYRTWYLEAHEEFFGLIDPIRRSINSSNIDKVIAELDKERIRHDIIKELYEALVASVSSDIPLSVTEATVKEPRESKKRLSTNGKQWEIEFNVAGKVNIVVGSGMGAITLTSADGKKTIAHQNNAALLRDIGTRLSQGGMPTLLIQVLTGKKIPSKQKFVEGFVVKLVATGNNTWEYEYKYTGTRLLAYNPAKIQVLGLSYQSTAAERDLFARSQNRNPLAYEKLSASDAYFPWSLPYDFPLAETRETLRAAGVPRLSLLELTTASADRYKSKTIAQERLGLSSAEWDLINTTSVQTSGGAKSEFWKIWGISSTIQTIRDTFTDLDITAAPFGNDGLLTRVSIILQQARLSFAELQQLLKSDFINPNGTVGIHPDNVCHPSEMRLSVIDANVLGPVLDRLHRFVRLWRATGWDIWELDITITGVCNRNIDSDNSLVQIANLGLLRDRLNLPIDVLVAMIGGFGNKRYSHPVKDEFQELTPLYERLFQNRQLVDPPAEALAFSATLSALTDQLKEIIAASIGIRKSDLIFLLGSTEIDIPRNTIQGKKNKLLQLIFRNVTLAKSVGLSIFDYEIAWRLFPSNHFASPESLLKFLDEIDFVKSSGFTWSELNYILLGSGSNSSQYGLTVQRSAEILTSLQRELKQLQAPESTKAVVHFALTSNDLKTPPLPETPQDNRERFEEHWGLLTEDGQQWVVKNPGGTGKLKGTGLKLLARIDVIAQQANVSPKAIEDAIKTSFVVRNVPLKLTTVSPVSIENLTIDHLDRLEIFLSLLRSSMLTAQDLGLLLQAFAATKNPMQWNLSNLIEPGQKILTLQARLQLTLGTIIGWWINAIDDDQIKPLAESLGVNVVDLKRLFTAFKAETRKEPLASPSNLVEFVDASTFLKQRIELVTQRLAQSVSLEPSFANSMLWDYLQTSETNPRSAMQYLISDKFKNSTDTSSQSLLVKSDEYAILVRLHKIALLNTKWKASLEELTWSNVQVLTQSDSFSGLVFDKLPHVKELITTATRAQQKVRITGWKQSTRLCQMAHATSEMAQVVGAYLESYQKAATNNEKMVDSRKSLADSFNLSEAAVQACASKLDIATNDKYLNPLRFDELIRLLGTVQKLGIDENNLVSLVAEVPNLVAAELGRKLLRPRFGESGWKKALRQVTDTLRIQQRDRLVDYLLTKKGLRDTNALYEYYLIDVEMSPCMNTTRLLQSTAAVQLFVQRCLFNLEKNVSPESIARDRWEWMQNYRVWEANRKVFLYPENWLFPEVRDNRTETFRAFESALTQSEPSHENAISSMSQYLDSLVEIAQIRVIASHVHTNYITVEVDNIRKTLQQHTLYQLGRSRNPAYAFYWRKCQRFGEQAMCWSGWEKIDGDIDGFHTVLFVHEGDLHVAWAILSELEGGSSTAALQVQIAWMRRQATGWTPRKTNANGPWKFNGIPARELAKQIHLQVRYALGKPEVWVYAGKAATVGFTPNPTPPTLTEGIDGPIWTDKPSQRIQPPGSKSTVIPLNPTRNSMCRITVIPNIHVKYEYGNGSVHYEPASNFQVDAILSPPGQWGNNIGSTFCLRQGIRFSGDISQRTQNGRAVNADVTISINLLNPPNIPAEPFRGKQEISLVDAEHVYYVSHIFTVMSAPPGLPTNQQAVPMTSEARLIFGSLGEATLESCPVNEQLDTPSNTLPEMSSFTEIGNTTNGSSLSNGNGKEIIARSSASQFRLRPASEGPSQGIMDTWWIEEDSTSFLVRIDPPPEALKVLPGSFHEAGRYRESFYEGENQLFDNAQRSLMQRVSVYGMNCFGFYFPNLVSTQDPSKLSNPAFDSRLPNSLYNWEVFYHIPIAVAVFLSRQHRFEDARRWFHFVFDPTTNDPSTGRERFWRFLPFRNAQVPDTITQLLEALAGAPTGNQQSLAVQAQVAAWLEDPFNPFAVARLRTSAFEWYTVVAYIKNLIAWADQLFRRDTRESINEATLLYVIAAQILGPRPERIRARGASRQSLSYRALKTLEDESPNVWSTLADTSFAKAWNKSGTSQTKSTEFGPLSSIGSLYFCVPPNEKLPELWDMVDDRLFKIRHCQNIEGVTRSLPLYEPPIDPELLIRAKAAGINLADVLADRFAPLPHYRFHVLLQKANEFCNEVKTLGGAILSAVEKKEAEHLALLRSSQEIAMLKLIESVKVEQIKEAQANIESLEKTKKNALDRFTFLQRQLGKEQVAFDATGSPIVEQSLMVRVQDTGTPDDFRSLSLIQPEIDQVWRLQDGHIWSVVAGATKASAGVFHMLAANPFNITWAPAVGHGLSAVADGFGLIATNASFWERRASLIAGWQRRRDEWVQQSKMTAEEIRQIDKQILALNIRKSIAEKELENHRQQIEHASNIDDYMRHLKFSGESLYGWMESQLSGLYFCAYQMAYDLAKCAERAMRYELGDDTISFVQFGHWDNLRKGLLSGDRLSHNLRRMEAAYLDRNKRELEITKHVSLRQLDGLALIRLRAEGECEFEIPEAVFDLDFPGHYFRRIKSVSISVPCVVGPYTSVNGTLTLLSSRLREKSVPSVSYDDESNYRSSYLPIQSISTSSGQNDSGLFELNFRDERYLPFEGAGAISRWKFTLPKDFKALDYDTISDVILHIRYTARDGGALLHGDAVNNLKAFIKGAQAAGTVQMFSIRDEFPTEWARFKKSNIDLGSTPKVLAGLTLNLEERHYPFWSQGSLGSVGSVELFARIDKDVTIYSQADGSGAADTLATSLGNLRRGGLVNNKPQSPKGTFTLYFDDKSMEDLWLALEWGK